MDEDMNSLQPVPQGPHATAGTRKTRPRSGADPVTSNRGQLFVLQTPWVVSRAEPRAAPDGLQLLPEQLP